MQRVISLWYFVLTFFIVYVKICTYCLAICEFFPSHFGEINILINKHNYRECYPDTVVKVEINITVQKE